MTHHDTVTIWRTEDWRDAQPFVELGLASNEHTLMTSEDIRLGFINDTLSVYEILLNGARVGIVVFEMVYGSLGSAMNILSLAGEHMDRWLDKLLEFLEMSARQNRCRYILEIGRQGWTRVLDKHGWKPGPAVMIKELSDG